MAAPDAVAPLMTAIDYKIMPTADKYTWVDNPHTL